MAGAERGAVAPAAEAGADEELNAEFPTSLESAELVALACPRVILTRRDFETLRDLVRDCDRELEHRATPDRACDPARDGLCVK